MTIRVDGSGDSANLVKIADNLKGLTDKALMQMANSMNSFAPPYMIDAEMQRREKLRKSYDPSFMGIRGTSVREDLQKNFKLAKAPDHPMGYKEGGMIPSYNTGRLIEDKYLNPFVIGGDEEVTGTITIGPDGMPIYSQPEPTKQEGLPNPTQSTRFPYDAYQGMGGITEAGQRAQSPTKSPFRRFLENFGYGANKEESERLLEAQKYRNKILNETFKNPFAGETEKQYKERMKKREALADSYKKDFDPQTGKLRSGAKEEVKEGEAKEGEAKEGEEVKKGEGIRPLTLKDVGKPRAGIGTISGVNTIQSPTTTGKSKYTDLLAQEYEQAKKDYDQAKLMKDTSFGQGLMTAGLGLLGGQDIGTAGQRGLSAYQKQKALQRKTISDLAKQKRGVVSGLANIELKERELGIKAADVGVKQANAQLKMLMDEAKLGMDRQKIVTDIFGEIQKSATGQTLNPSEAMRLAISLATGQPIDSVTQEMVQDEPWYKRFYNKYFGDEE